MIVGIDIRVLAKGARTGIEEYVINLLSRLLSLDKNIQFKLFYSAFSKIELDYDWLKLPNVELKKFNYPNRFIFDPLAKFFNLPKIDRLLGGADVFFTPHFLLSPVSKNCRKITTFHDLSFEYFPEFFPYRKRFWHKFLNPKERGRESDRIIAVSNSTREDLITWYGLPEEKIEIIYSGIGEEFEKKVIVSEPALKIREKYGLPEKFILYFGTIEPRKNLTGLIRAYEIVREKYGIIDYKLVIAGSRGWLDKKIFAQARKSPCADQIIFAGYVEPDDKVWLYNLASLFVYPSFFEGFGFPPLEAMACGVPVICSNTSSFPEVAGEAALMVDTYNYDEIAWAIAEILQDGKLQDLLIGKGLKRAIKFSWEKCANETLAQIAK